MKHNQNWSVVVFCYNEAGTIHGLLDRLFELFDAHRKGRYEIIVVDDGSTDGSYEKILEAQQEREDVVQVLRHRKNLGIGRTLRDGYLAALNENISAVPADGQFDVHELIPYLDIEENTFVSFYRLENVQYTRFRTALSAINKYINKILNGIELKDVNWVKIYKRESIVSFPWMMKSSIIESEICTKLLITGTRAVEVLSYYHPRRSGKSKGASLRITLQALRETLKLIWTVRKFRKSMRNQS